MVARRSTSTRAKATTKSSAAASSPTATPQRKPKAAVTSGISRTTRWSAGRQAAPLVDERADEHGEADDDDAGREEADRHRPDHRGADRQRERRGAGRDPRRSPGPSCRGRWRAASAPASGSRPTRRRGRRRGWRCRRPARSGSTSIRACAATSIDERARTVPTTPEPDHGQEVRQAGERAPRGRASSGRQPENDAEEAAGGTGRSAARRAGRPRGRARAPTARGRSRRRRGRGRAAPRSAAAGGGSARRSRRPRRPRAASARRPAGSKSSGEVARRHLLADGHAEAAHDQQVAGGGQETQDHRQGEVAGEHADPKPAEQPGGAAHGERGRRDVGGDGGEGPLVGRARRRRRFRRRAR